MHYRQKINFLNLKMLWLSGHLWSDKNNVKKLTVILPRCIIYITDLILWYTFDGQRLFYKIYYFIIIFQY